MVIDEKTKKLLISFHKIRARVTGSLARGEFKENWSDIDLQIPEKNWDKAKEIIKNSEFNWIDKGIGGSVGTKETSVMIDVSYVFDKTPKINKLDFVNVGGIIFKTW